MEESKKYGVRGFRVSTGYERVEEIKTKWECRVKGVFIQATVFPENMT